MKTKQKNPVAEPEKPFRYIDVSSVSNTEFRVTEASELLGADAPSRARRLLCANDVIFATVRPTLKRVAMIPSELDGEICSTGFCVVRAEGHNADAKFIYYLLLSESVTARVKDLQTGATYPAINDSDLLNLNFALPPLPEQRAIASTLRAVQNAKDARRREVELERERKAALMSHLFRHGTRGEALHDTSLGKLPQSWRVVKLGEVCERPTYGYTDSATVESVGPKFLRITDIQDGGVNWDTVPYCRAPKDEPRLKSGDIVVARIGATTGKAFMIQECPDAVFASYLIRVRVKSDLRADFLSYFMQMPEYWQQIDANKGGKLKGGVNVPILQGLTFPLPPLEEQQEIAAILRACDDKLAALNEEIARLEELFRALLEELMSGRLSTAALT